MVGCEGDERGMERVQEDFVRRVVAMVVKMRVRSAGSVREVGTSHAAVLRGEDEGQGCMDVPEGNDVYVSATDANGSVIRRKLLKL